MRYLLDPPNGWRYGFPKWCPKEIYESPDQEAVIKWLVSEGYPEETTRASWFHYRVIRHDEPLDTTEIKEFRAATDMPMFEAKSYLQNSIRESKRREIADLLESGTLEDVTKAFKIFTELIP